MGHFLSPLRFATVSFHRWHLMSLGPSGGGGLTCPRITTPRNDACATLVAALGRHTSEPTGCAVTTASLVSTLSCETRSPCQSLDMAWMSLSILPSSA
jgi:hypothetical protein